MKQFTKILVCFLVLAMMVATVACGETPAETTPATTTPAETTPAETTPAETTPVETTPAETTAAETPAATTAETTTAEETTAGPSLPEGAPLDPAAIANHSPMPLWPDGQVYGFNASLGAAPTIKAYVADGAKSAVVIFPGGGYSRISSDIEGDNVAQAFNAQGITAFVVNYRVADYTHKEILADGWRSVQFVRYYADTFGIDADKVAVCGFSAGGHLAMAICEHQPEDNLIGDAVGALSAHPDYAILSYPVVQLIADRNQLTSCNFAGLLRAGRDKDAYNAAVALVDEYSFGTNLDGMPATFLWCGSKDTTADPKINSEAMAAAMTAANMDVKFTEYAGVGHGVGLASGTAASGWMAEAIAFLQSKGF